MPPTVMTPWLTPCAGLCVVLVGLVDEELLPPELLVPPELFGAEALDFPLELFPAGAAWLRGAGPPPLTTCVAGALPPLLAGASAAGVGPPPPLLLLLGA